MIELKQNFGYSELYEWSTIPIDSYRYGRFVQFDQIYPDKIKLLEDNMTPILGVTTVNSVIISNESNYWYKKYKTNEYGDIYVEEKKFIECKKDYDDIEELPILKTQINQKYEGIINKDFDIDRIYRKRNDRPEWTQVNLLGKCIVVDFGKCDVGSWCTPIFSKDLRISGTVKPCNYNISNKFYVLSRYSKDTVIIFYK